MRTCRPPLPETLYPSHHEQDANYPSEKTRPVLSQRFAGWLAAEYSEHWRALEAKRVSPKK